MAWLLCVRVQKTPLSLRTRDYEQDDINSPAEQLYSFRKLSIGAGIDPSKLLSTLRFGECFKLTQHRLHLSLPRHKTSPQLAPLEAQHVDDTHGMLGGARPRRGGPVLLGFRLPVNRRCSAYESDGPGDRL
jgi:hypothetical protein